MKERPVEALFRLSPQQQGMLFESLYGSGRGLHVQQLTWTMTGEVDADRFQEAWRGAVERHAILRTAFVWKEQDEPLQAVLRRVELALDRHDWRSAAAGEREERWQELLAQDLATPFDLARAPLMRLALVRTGRRSQRFVWTFHHILLDGWSWPMVLRDVLAHYLARTRGEEPPSRPSPPYGDYIRWYESQDQLRAMHFWRRTLGGFTRPTPLGRPDPEPAAPEAAEAIGYGSLEARLPAATSRALEALVRSQELTFGTLIQGLWALLLSRFSGDDDVTFGATVSGRPGELEGIESMVGLFINTLPVRVRVDPDAVLPSWLEALLAHHLEVRSYEYCSEGQIHQWSDLPGSRPLYESIVVFENFPVDFSSLEGGGLELEIEDARMRGAYTKHAVSLLVIAGRELGLRLTYDGRRLDRAAAERILEAFQTLAGEVATDPERSLGELVARIPEAGIPRVRQREEDGGRAQRPGFVAPRTPTEEALARLWAEALGLRRVGVEDNFFELGGHSLLATEILRRTREAFQVELPLRHLFESPTVAGLAVVIAQKQAEAVDEAALSEMLERLESLPEDRAAAGGPRAEEGGAGG